MGRRKLQALIGLLAIMGVVLSCAPAVPAERQAASAPTAAATLAPGAATKPAAAATPKAATVATEADKPVYGGILPVSMRESPPSFDVHQVMTISVLNTISSCYNTLLTWDHIDHQKMVADLAKKWELSPDGLAFTFYLEEGAKWHDGTPFTAEDVRYSLMREKDPPKGVYIFARGMFEPMQSVEVVNPYTVKVTMSRPTASFPLMMTLVCNAILPKHVLEKKTDMKFDAMGTGPWKLKEFVTDVSIELRKNPDYFKKGLPYMDGRIGYIMRDPSARLAAFRVGRVLTDVSDHEPPAIDTIEQTMKDVASAYRIPGMPVTTNPFMNQTKPPFNDVRIRQAVSLGIDRWEFCRVVNPGFNSVGGYMTPGGQWHLADEELNAQPGYAKTGPAKDAEREQAKRLLAEAGYPDGFDFELEAREHIEYQNQAIFLKSQLEKIGLRGNIKVVDITTYYDHLTKQGFQMMASANGFDGDDPDLIFSMAFIKDAGKNYGKYYNPEFDKMFVEQSTAVDTAKRKEMVRRMQLMLHDTAPYPVLGWWSRTVGVWKKVKGYTPWANNSRLSAVGRHEDTWLDPNLPPK